MVPPNLNQVCEQAKLYYYDFLFQADKTDIPEEVLSHYKKCSHCQKKIYELKTAVTREEFKSRNGVNSGTPLSNMLKLHFSYVDHDVNCQTVKPFLPGLLNESMQISVPTPITAHLDHCAECAQDLKKIRDLDLNESHLLRLGSLFAAKPDNDIIDCSTTKRDSMAFVMLAFHESSEQILKHLCSCNECRSEIYKYRETVLAELLQEKKEKPCFLSTKLSNNEIFDFLIPYELDLVEYKKSESQQSRISHIRRCPFCLEKIQEFHRTIFGIAERPDSGIVTTYNVEDSSQAINIDNSEDLYAGFPVNVEVSGTREKAPAMHSGSIINFTAALKQKITAPDIKSTYVKALAGLIMVGAVLTGMFFYSPKAKALNLQQLYNSIETINNVHILTFMSGETEPSQEQWLSRSKKIEISKINNKFVLSDILHKKQITKLLDSGKENEESLSDEKLKDYERIINHSLGLVPFYDISELPDDSKWIESPNINGRNKVYELIYPAPFSDFTYNKLIFTLEAGTERLIRVDFERKSADDSEYKPETTKKIEYWSDEEISKILSSFD